MAIEILKKIQAFDNTVKNKFTGDYPAPPPKIDRILKWVPILSVLLTDAARAEARNKLAKRLKIIALSEAILNGILSPLKKMAARRRPDAHLQFDSFPSGHTATSFMGAEILHRAYKEKIPSIGIAGYTIAAATAAVRVYKKKHWLSDVIAGAVLGIVSAKIASWIINRQTENSSIKTLT